MGARQEIAMTNKETYTMRSKVWVYRGSGAWHFVTLPKKQGKEIQEKYGKYARGWRSLPVRVTIGETSWDTSIFPDKKEGSYVLPLKAAIRKKEDIHEDDTVKFAMVIR